jgi:hypothetical protein
MPVVPISKVRKPTPQRPPAPAEPFALMAAAQMHQEGRLASEADALPPQLGGKEPT